MRARIIEAPQTITQAVDVPLQPHRAWCRLRSGGCLRCQASRLARGDAALVVIGAVNWGLVALAEFDLVAFVVGLQFGETNALSRVVYGLVGLSGLYHAARLLARRPSTATAQPARG